MANFFYTNARGEKVGPLTGVALKALAQQGVITSETTIENEHGRTTVASQVKGLTFPETKPSETVQPVEAEIYGLTLPEPRAQACPVPPIGVSPPVAAPSDEPNPFADAMPQASQSPPQPATPGVTVNSIIEAAKETAKQVIDVGKERFMRLDQRRQFAVIAGTVLLVLIGGWWMMGSSTRDDYDTMYATLNESIEALDSLVDETYRCWHGQVYNRKYSDIDAAIAAARQNESSNVSELRRNDAILSDLVKKIKSTNSKNRDKELYNSMLDAYDSYREYYEFGYNVSGSFSSFKEKIEPQKKETKSYLNKFKRNL